MTATILVIDDSEDDQLLYRRALKDCDCILEMASTAEAGFAHMTASRPDLILLDYNLPDADGLSFMKRLDEHSRSTIPIVMLTGESIAAVAVEAMKHGADDYLVKDTGGHYLQQLPDVLRRVLTSYEHRKQARLLRQETERLLRRNQILMQNSMDGIYVMDMQGDIVEANDAFCKMLGYTMEEAARLNVTDWDAQWSKEELQERFKALIGKSVRFETAHRRKDGKLIDVEISASGLEIDGQNFMFASSRDITERKHFEAGLQRYKRVLETAIDGFWLTDIQGNLLEANEAYAQMSGYTADELTHMHISQLDANENPEEVQAHIANLMNHGYERFETRHRRKDGQVLDIEIAATIVPESNQIFVFCRDISERHKMETKLKRYKAAVVDAAMDGFWLADMQGNLLEANEAYAQISGYTVEELTRMHISQIDVSGWLENLQTHIAKFMEQGCDRFETRHRRKDGQVLDIEISVTPMPESGHLFVFSRNITERKQSEDALRIAAVAFETHDAILISDTRANIIRVNQAFTDITGYSQDEVIGKNPRIMSSGRQDKAFYIEMWQQLLHTGSWAGEIWDKRKSGQIYPKWLTITAVKNERQETTHFVAIFSDITARKQAEEEIRNLAFYDALTRLPNRRLFMDRFRAALTISTRRNDYGAILFIDLDRFKTLNDTLGHDYGDMLLIEVSARIKSCVREMDTVARLGGDEFVVLIEGISGEQEDASHNVGIIAEKIRETLAQPYKLKTHEHHSSPSIGISLYRGHEATVDELLQQADMAMYQAKTAGRNAVRFFDPVMQHNVATRAELENDLHHAIPLGQLQLHYQVQVDAEARPQGAEALLRWFHPQRGLVMPGQFIPIAEESSLILEIGHWVLEQACGQLAQWAVNERMRNLTLAVNVSAKQFAQPNFVDQVAGCLNSHGISPALLKLELTESLVLHDLNNTISKMHALKELGIKLSLDDFGTGYSSLSYLKQLPLDQIKIDQGFVQGIALDGNDALLVQTIIDLAGNFRLNVIAEGVETEGQLAFLKNRECAAFQGYLFGKALPVEELEEMVNSM